jgi:uncharacterized membrane protein YheB (UPF0754 family)
MPDTAPTTPVTMPSERARAGQARLAITGITLVALTVTGGVLRTVLDDALWTQIWFAVSIGGLVGFATNWIAIKMLFHPRVKVFGWQGVVPKRREELARSVGRMLEEHLISGDRMHRLLVESGAVDEAIDKLADHLPQLMADDTAREIIAREVERTMDETIQKVMSKAKASLKDSARSTVNALLAGGGAAAMFSRLGPLGAALAGGLTAGGVKTGLLNPLVDKVVDKLAEDLAGHEAMREVADGFVDSLPERTRDVLADERVRAKLRDLIGETAEELVNAIDVAGLVEREILARDEGELEALIDDVAANEMSFIQIAGGGLGMVAGLALIWPWLLLPYGAAFGVVVLIARSAERKHRNAA